MEVQNKSKAILNINCPDSYKNKVYINPNFNRSQINSFPSNAIMHVNPKFSYLVPNVQCNIQNKSKIYVNPNFIKSRNVGDNNQCMSISVNKDVIPDNIIVNSMNMYQQQAFDKEAKTLQVPVAQSRYCFVRQNETNKQLKEPVPEKVKKTFKLNKYKTVPWKDIKINLDNVKNITNNNSTYMPRFETNSQTPNNKKVMSSLVPNSFTNQFKLINYNNVSPVKQDKIKTKIYSDTYKKLTKPNQMSQSRVKKLKGNLKKNNIPCPLFRKFGKCLRNVRGTCEFLHDKKHISICRKFIKGLCHDKDCLLSHDLTSKKMPTCYFYLKGTCTKVECPYLHVKLNENTKICPDFVKGYCEKGSKCLQRHINVTERKNKRTLRIKDSVGNKYSKTKISQVSNNCEDEEVSPNIKKQGVNSVKSFLVKGENYSEYRYYEEHRDDNSTNESSNIIKPMRCKLGTLPSFIQL